MMLWEEMVRYIAWWNVVTVVGKAFMVRNIIAMHTAMNLFPLGFLLEVLRNGKPSINAVSVLSLFAETNNCKFFFEYIIHIVRHSCRNIMKLFYSIIFQKLYVKLILTWRSSNYLFLSHPVKMFLFCFASLKMWGKCYLNKLCPQLETLLNQLSKLRTQVCSWFLATHITRCRNVHMCSTWLHLGLTMKCVSALT